MVKIKMVLGIGLLALSLVGCGSSSSVNINKALSLLEAKYDREFEFVAHGTSYGLFSATGYEKIKASDMSDDMSFHITSSSIDSNAIGGIDGGFAYLWLIHDVVEPKVNDTIEDVLDNYDCDFRTYEYTYGGSAGLAVLADDETEYELYCNNGEDVFDYVTMLNYRMYVLTSTEFEHEQCMG